MDEMELQYFGFNGFNQFPRRLESEDSEDFKSHTITAKNVKAFDTSWNSFVWISDCGAVMFRGFADGYLTCKTLLHPLVDDSYEDVIATRFYIVCLTRKGKCFILNVKENFKLYEITSLNEKILHGSSMECETFILDQVGQVHNIDLMQNMKINSIPLDSNLKIIAVSCGKEHVILLSSLGTVLTYGNGSRGQLGHGSVESITIPKLVDCLEGLKIKAVSAGGWHSVALSESGDIYTWGWNNNGQLGLPCENVNIQSFPQLIELEITIVQVSCGSRHTAILSSEGSIWSFGWNGYGQLGNKHLESTSKPVKVEEFEGTEKPIYIKCGEWCTIIGISK